MSEHDRAMAADPRGFVTMPAGEYTKHECPPEASAMMARMEEISSSYERRLLNQKQVIDNLSDARQKLLAHVGELHAFLDNLVDNEVLTGDTELRARRLVQWEETP